MGTDFPAAFTRPAALGAGPAWPAPVGEAALSGIAGDLVRTLAPHTEADQHALLFQFLTAFGNLIGRGPHFTAEATRHGTNLNVVLVGETAKGRKGTSWNQVRRPLATADPEWALRRIQSGLSSGEGLIWAVRDATTRPKSGRAKGSKHGDTEYTVDAGISDKRLLVMESEFASPLCVMRREGNTLSSLLRLAWETGDLQGLTKNSPAVATGAHISVIGHITRHELSRHLTETEAANGFANRFLWVCVRRSKVLPEGGSLGADELLWITGCLEDAVRYAHRAQEMKRDEEARDLWREVYPELSEGQPGLFGAITSRAEAQTMRLALIYALLDQSPAIGRGHLEAALALWGYSERSCRYIFGSALGDPIADQALAALQAKPEGLTRTNIRDLFGRHARSAEVDRALRVLLERRLAAPRFEETGGRRTERWVICATATNAT